MSFQFWLLYISVPKFLFGSLYILFLCWLSILPFFRGFTIAYWIICVIAALYSYQVIPRSLSYWHLLIIFSHTSWTFPGVFEGFLVLFCFFVRQVVLDCFLVFWIWCMYFWVLLKFYGKFWYCSFSSQLPWLGTDYKLQLTFRGLWIQSQFSV